MLKRLIRETLELLCRKRWLKQIDKEISQRDKCYREYKRHDYIAKHMAEEYENLRKKNGR